MTGVKSSHYGRVRRAAFDLWRGPEYVQKHDENSSFGGRAILHLALRKGTSANPAIESRTVFVDMADTAQQDAIVRAVLWDSQTVERKKSNDDLPIRIPALFVKVPTAQVRGWIAAFDHLKIALPSAILDDDTIPVCTLSIEKDSVYCAFALTWQVVGDENADLNRIWLDVWEHMGKALLASPIVVGVEEFFPCSDPPKDAYDSQGYRPSLTLP